MEITIQNRKVGDGHPCFIVAEMSSNHGQNLEKLKDMIRSAGQAGADAVKLQTYTPDTITMDCDKPWFYVNAHGNPEKWRGQTLYQLYQKSYTPWEWHPEIKKLAEELGMIFFSSAFDETSVDFLETLDVPCYKIASYEATDIPLLRKIASTGKPIILSVGFATLEEIEYSLSELRGYGDQDIILLQCAASYSKEQKVTHTNLETMRDLRARFNVLTGFSDNMGGVEAPVLAAAMGAAVIEKHFVLDHTNGGLDERFSLDPSEFRQMVEKIRRGEMIAGHTVYGPQTKEEEDNCRYRRSLFAGKDIKKGEIFTSENTRNIRPAHGLPTKHLDEILGRYATRDIERGDPLSWEMIGE
jgi:pseudaminic acid synthase